MALSIAGVRASVKVRMDIPTAVTSFDAAIDEFVQASVDRLFPMTGNEVPVQTVNISPDAYGEVVVDLAALATPAAAARLVETSAGYEWQPNRELLHHGTSLRVRNVSSSATQMRIYGLTPYIITTVPNYLAPALIWYSMSELYDDLAGNKRKFNIYAQINGRAAVDTMATQSTFYTEKADEYLNEHATVY